MADALRQVPAQYGPARRAFRPRLGAYGRRVLACLPALAVAVAGGLLLFWRRPPGGTGLTVLVLVVLAAAACWSRLRPALAVRTETHVLRSRTVGFAAAPLDGIEHVVLVEALRRAPDAPRGGATAHLWAAGRGGRRVLALDGPVWDARTLGELAESLGRPCTRVPSATAPELAARWPRLVPWRLRHPRVRSATTAAALLAVVGLVLWLPWAQQAGA